MMANEFRVPKILPPAYFFIAMVVMLGLNYLWPVTQWVVWPWTLVGVLFIVLGFTLTLSAAWQFRIAGTAIKPFEISSTLVTHGMFRYSRNPMYLGLLTILAGTAICLGSLTPVLVPPLFAWLITQRFISNEENILAQRFGEDYLRYKKSTPRWL
jgi:protein-S-isoprenylcysteine O-methyltransferase Ste14